MRDNKETKVTYHIVIPQFLRFLASLLFQLSYSVVRKMEFSDWDSRLAIIAPIVSCLHIYGMFYLRTEWMVSHRIVGSG